MKPNPFVQPQSPLPAETPKIGPFFLNIALFATLLMAVGLVTNQAFNSFFVRLSEPSYVIANGFSEVKSLPPGYHFKGIDTWNIYPAGPVVYTFDISGPNIKTGQLVKVRGAVVYKFKPKDGFMNQERIEMALYMAVKSAIVYAWTGTSIHAPTIKRDFSIDFEESVNRSQSLKNDGITVHAVSVLDVSF